MYILHCVPTILWKQFYCIMCCYRPSCGVHSDRAPWRLEANDPLSPLALELSCRRMCSWHTAPLCRYESEDTFCGTVPETQTEKLLRSFSEFSEKKRCGWAFFSRWGVFGDRVMFSEMWTLRNWKLTGLPISTPCIKHALCAVPLHFLKLRISYVFFLFVEGEVVISALSCEV